jgi:hypothetical protein
MGKHEYANTLSRGYSKSGYEGTMILLAKKLEENLKKSYLQPVWIARSYAHAGDKKNALIWLEKAYEERDPLMTNLSTSTDWVNLRGEKGFENLLKRMNFPQ